MKAHEIIEKLFEYGKDYHYEETCDTLKAGSPDTEVTKVAVAMFPTVDLLKEVKAWGAELLIVHEPVFYNHWDSFNDERVQNEKRALIKDLGLTIYRFHDHPHRNYPDLIAAGECKYLGLDGEVTFREDVFDLTQIKMNSPITALELARIIEERLNIRRVRLCGAIDTPCTKVSACFGAPGDVFDVLFGDETEILLIGECSEWGLAEYVRDAAAFGYNKSLITLGHIGSERAGMVYITDLLKEKIPSLEVKYFECGEVYTYTDKH